MKRSAIFIILLLYLSIATVAQTSSDRERGIELYRVGDFAKSAETLRSVVENNKKDKLAWLYLGATLLKLGNEKEATKAFRSSGFTFKDSDGSLDKKLNITHKGPAPYANLARENNISGTIKVAIEFREDGKIGFVFPFTTLPYGLTENAIAAAKEISFEPAEKNGKPVSVVTVLTYSFTIY
jgi:tetratricopeptide (TPR) repeat protein